MHLCEILIIETCNVLFNIINFGIKMSRKDNFLKIFLSHERHLFNYILMLVPNYSDAEDILQESVSIMWDKFDDFEPNSNFMAWASQIARYKISNYYRSKKEQFRLDDSLLDNLAKESDKSIEDMKEKQAALTGCLKKLQLSDRKLLQMRYYQKISIPKIAEQTGRSPHTLYKRISMIYRLLHGCVHRTLLAWGGEL